MGLRRGVRRGPRDGFCLIRSWMGWRVAIEVLRRSATSLATVGEEGIEGMEM